MKKDLIALGLLFLSFVSLSQESDTVKTLSMDEVYQIIRSFHPVAKQAEILLDRGKKQLRAARGGFDPKFYSNLREKDFKNGKDQYYNVAETGVKIPTWYGIELKTAFEDNRGVFLNPENNVPTEGLGVFGASITLGKGLLMDDRRATLRKAQLYQQSTTMERELMLNELFFDATYAFWNWHATYLNMKAYEEAIELSRVRFEGIKGSFEYGDVPAIDTLESLIQLRDIENEYQTAQTDFAKYKNELSTYLWDDQGNPYSLADDITPSADLEKDIESDVSSTRGNIDELVAQHPKMKILGYKGNMLLIDKRLKAEKLKPKINLNYNLITTGYNTDFNTNDFKWGFEIGIPLFLREGRGDFAVAKLKLRENQYDQNFTETKIRNKTLAQLVEVSNLIEQNQRYGSLVEGYETLLRTEEIKFSIGESSMFKVNARQLKLLNTQIKANKNVAKLYQSRGKLFKELGILHLQPEN